MPYEKKRILSKILECADLYNKDFVGRDLLFVYADSSGVLTFEASFCKSNFKHLTGIVSPDSANEFFSKAADKRLSESDFEVGRNSMSHSKLEALPEFLSRPVASVNMLGEYDSSAKKNLDTGTLVGGVKSCMGFIKNDSDIFVPNTFLAGNNEDIRTLVRDIKQVLAVWRKHRGEILYTEEWRVNKAKIGKMKLNQHYDSLKSERFKK